MKLKLLVSWTLMFICATSFAQFTSSEGAAIENSNSGKNGFYIQYNSIGSICTLGNVNLTLNCIINPRFLL